MKDFFSRLFIAISFLTILPIRLLFPKKEQENQDDIKENLSKSSIFFPIVGMIIGYILIGVDLVLKLSPLDPSIINGVVLAVWIVLSGGLHLEGFADMVDGFSGGITKEDIIRIMKDGSVGAKGAIALILMILLKFLLINSMPIALKKEALLMTPVIGRWSMVLAGYWGKPASPDNILTKYFTLSLGKKELVLATFFTLVITFYSLSYQSLYLMFFSALISYLMAHYSFTKIHGICGDVIGAVNEITEVSVLLFFILLTNKYLVFGI